jgi:hypothetical protein
MSVADILREMGEVAARRHLARGQVLGGAIAGAAQIPAQIMADRERLRIQQQQDAQRAEQLGFQRSAQQRADKDQTAQDAARSAEQRQNAVAHEIVTAYTGGTPNDPTTNSLDAGIAKARELDAAEWIPKLRAMDAAERAGRQPKITQLDSTKDTYENGVLTRPGVPKPLAPPKPAAVGSFEDYSTATPERKKQIEADRKAYQQADDRPRITVNAGAGAAGGGLDEGGLELLATQYRIQGTTAIPTRISGPDRERLINLAAKQAKALGKSPAQVIQKQYALKSDGAALTTITKMSSAAEAFESKAIQQAELVRSLSAKVKRTEYPLINAALQSGREATGDTDAHLFANGLLTFTTEYAKLMEGSTGSAAGSSDAARKDAARLIGTALNNGTIDKTLDQMKWEMQQTRHGYDVVIDGITRRMGGGPSAAGPAAAGGPVSVAAPNGKNYTFPTQAAADAFKLKAGIK